jgi:hypothetical protein
MMLSPATYDKAPDQDHFHRKKTPPVPPDSQQPSASNGAST